MKHRVLWSTIATVAAVHVILVLSAWWVGRAPAVPAAPPTPAQMEAPAPPSPAIQRLAELFAGAAFRSVITFDYAALNDLVRRAAAWPEVIYVSVEDAHGKIIAHTDPARIGQGWNPAAGRELAAGRGSLQEAVAPMSASEVAGKPSPRVGQVRLGYLVDGPGSLAAPAAAPEPVAPAPASRTALFVILAAAALAAIPVGFAVIKLAGAGAAPADVPVADLRKIRSLRQARWTIAHWTKEAELVRVQLAAQREEVARLTEELAERTGRLADADAKSEQLLTETAHWLDERERLRAELREQHRELEQARAALQARMADAEAPRLERALLEAEVADLRDEVQAARTALGRHPLVCRELLDQELRQHQHRAIGYISHAIRSSLTNVLGFSKLLLRGSEGPLDEPQRASVLNIHEAGNHLLRIVNDLSDLTQVEAGTLDLREEVVDVAAVLQEVVEAAGATRSGGPEAITVDCPVGLPPVRANERRLIQILLALTESPAPDTEGPTEVSARAEGDLVMITVAHRGAPVSAQDLPTLFDPFAPIDATASLQDNGVRLRLALARALSTTIGGHLAVEIQDDAGTMFMVTVPAVADVPAVA
ncbi:MAG TPA: histidine kinase dimerization/phospho-acceptor domain-containing protein [Methylomirabilota bacterium]|nr:histidine kinase dimerization/phospho-acceptor domain-containing protein [Methylomirabilota bacterium]